MRDVPIELTLAFRTNASHDEPASACLRVDDASSGVPLLEVDLSSGQLVALLASASIKVAAVVPNPEMLQRIGLARTHKEHTPGPGVLDLPASMTAPTLEMIEYGDAYRERYDWDSATWHYHHGEGWCLHLVRWEREQAD